MDEYQRGPMGWRRPLAVLGLVAILCAVGFLVVGTHASSILSTVGASVNSGGGTVSSGDAGDEPSGNGDAAGGGGSTAGAGSGGGRSDAVSASMLDASRPDLLVIKTGEISLQAASIGPTIQKLTDGIVGLGGYASGSSRSGALADERASVTFRVPASQWEAALAVVRRAGDTVIDEQTKTEDVTGDVVDLEARIRNLQATESAIEAIMARAGSIKDVLDVESRLSEVRGQIEQLSAKAKDLQGRAAYSALTVHVSVKPAPVVAKPKVEFDAAHEADAATSRLIRLVQQVATGGIWVAIVWLPIVGALAVLGGIAFLVVRRLRRAFDGQAGTRGDGTPLAEGGT